MCSRPLKCVSNRCLDMTGRSAACHWALRCLRRLARSNHPDANRAAAAGQLNHLTRQPLKQDCLALARTGIPAAFKPWVWKPLCRAPPIDGLVFTGKLPKPFLILDKKITASRVPPDDRFFQKRTGPGHFLDQCRAWVKFKVIRKFQGRVVAVYFREHDCRKVAIEERRTGRRCGRKRTKEVCRIKRYERTDSLHYLNVTQPGTVKQLWFYVETPPEVCEDRVRKSYPTGCYCVGLSKEKIELEPIEDPFLHPFEPGRR